MSLGCCVDKACTPDTCMRLPDGVTCGSCLHLKRCTSLGYTSSAESTSCDFFPRRFMRAPPPAPPPAECRICKAEYTAPTICGDCRAQLRGAELQGPTPHKVLDAIRSAARRTLGDPGPFLGNLRKIEAAALEDVAAVLRP